MTTDSTTDSVKIAIVGMTGSGKTVLVTTLAMKMAQMSLDDIFLAPYGENRRQTLRYTQGNWQILNNGQWPPSTPAGELIELQWELNTKNCQAIVQFLDCAGQDIRSLFGDERFDPASLSEDLKRVYDTVNSANVLIFLVNMKDLLATLDMTDEILDLDEMFHTLKQRNDIPRRIAVAFSQFDKYKPQVDQQFNGDFLEYVRHYLPYLYGLYKRFHNFEMIPVAAVNDTQDVLEDGVVKQYPVPFFSSYNLETLIHWIADSVEELDIEIADAKKREEERLQLEREEEERKRTLEQEQKQREAIEKAKIAKESEKQRPKKLDSVLNIVIIAVMIFMVSLPILLSLFYALTSEPKEEKIAEPKWDYNYRETDQYQPAAAVPYEEYPATKTEAKEYPSEPKAETDEAPSYEIHLD